ncbi:MAG: REDY-like protein HapK [Bacteroidota bacterium]
MAALVVLFNLKDQSSRDAYEKWAQTTDVPTVKGLKSVDDFKVYKLQSMMGSEDPAPYQYCEIIDINDMAGLGPELETETMQKVAGEFQAFAENPLFIISEQIA